MFHKQQPTQAEDDLGGEYCTLKHEYKPTGIRSEKPNAQTAAKATQPCSPKPESNNVKTSPKQKVSRSKSSPESIARSTEHASTQTPKHLVQENGYQLHNSGSFVVSSGRRSVGHVKVGGRRSTGSLSGREPPPPLRYFAYLGRLAPSAKPPPRSRVRLPSAHDILADRPVILTSTSIVSPYATDVIRREIEEIERQERQAEYNDLLDCCTCMCCVKALFYHCTHDDEDEGNLAEHPCSCKGPVSDCVGRWGIMGLISIFLPCLLCYLPFEVGFRCHDCWTRGDYSKGTKTDTKAKNLPEIRCQGVVTEEPTSPSVNSATEMRI